MFHSANNIISYQKAKENQRRKKGDDNNGDDNTKGAKNRKKAGSNAKNTGKKGFKAAYKSSQTPSKGSFVTAKITKAKRSVLVGYSVADLKKMIQQLSKTDWKDLRDGVNVFYGITAG